MPEGDDTKRTEQENEKEQDQTELLMKSVAMIAQGLRELQEGQKAMLERFSFKAEREPPAEEEEEKAEEPESDDVDLEQLDRKQFAEVIGSRLYKKIESALNKKLKELEDRISSVYSAVESRKVEEQVAKLSSENPDFWEWADEMKAILKENPTLSVARAFALAKSENKEKAARLAAKYNKEQRKGNVTTLSLFPTGPREGRTGKMSQKEAIETAFQKVFSEVGDVLEERNIV